MITTVIWDVGGLVDWLSWCTNKPIAFDTETNGLMYTGLEMYGFSICDGSRACYVDLLVMSTKERATALEVLGGCIDSAPLLIMHNAPFDLKVLFASGIRWEPKVFCTMTAAHLLNENRSKGLKRLAITDLNVPEKDIQDWEAASDGGFSTPKFYKYATNDAVWTWGLYELYKPLISRQGLGHLFYKVEMPFQYVLRDLAINGIYIDQAKLAALTNEVSNHIFELEIQMLDMIGIRYSLEQYFDGRRPTICSNVNFNSDQQVADILINKFGIKLTEETESSTPECRRYSVKADVLKRLGIDHEFLNLFLEYSKYTHLLSNFLEPLPDHIEADGRVRPDFNNCVAVTGRLSSSNPNFQNLPKAETIDVPFRAVVLAATGNDLVGADYASQELRVLAEESRDESLIRAFNEGLNLHLITAKKQFGLDIPDEALVESHPDFATYKSKFKVEYNNAKIINYGISYGKGAFGFSKDWDVSLWEAQKTVDGYFEAFPSVKDAIDKTHKFVRQNGFCASLSGRRRRFPVVNNRSLRQSFNFLIQGYSADMLKMAMVQLRASLLEAGLEAKIILTVHDEIVVECPSSETEQVSCLLHAAMVRAVSLCVPLETDVKVGKTYAEIK